MKTQNMSDKQSSTAPRLQQKNKHVLMIVLVSGVSICVLLFILAGYLLSWRWTGFFNKTLWEWMQLLIVPLVLTIGGFFFNLTTSRNEQKNLQSRVQVEYEIALDNQRETLLQAYLDRMSDLLLNNHLRESEVSDEVRYIARARTLTILPRLDAIRKESLLQFLYESDLISSDTGNSIIQLSGADLSHTNLSSTYLSGANLSRIKLRKATLRGVTFSGTDLSYSNLCEADLHSADLFAANFSGADLSGTDLSGTDLSEANLSGANLYRANLNGANLSRTTLTGADLSEANLSGADLSETRLSGAIITKEQIEKAKPNKDR